MENNVEKIFPPYDLVKVLMEKYPTCKWRLDGDYYEGLTWFDDNEIPQPSQEELFAYGEELKLNYKNNQYQRDRAVAYPSIQDQLDLLYHGGLDAWKEEINKVKEQYPKPEAL